MDLELDHVFVCVSPGGVEADALVRAGFAEGAPNRHQGQGTANRRFFFRNMMLELLWVCDAVEAQTAETAITGLWQRWSRRLSGACPFGIILGPGDSGRTVPPFPAEEYNPAWLTPGLQIHIGRGPLEEPMLVFMPFLNRMHRHDRDAVHPNGARCLTRLAITSPAGSTALTAKTFRSAELYHDEGNEHLLSLEFDDARQDRTCDFRPELPLLVHL